MIETANGWRALELELDAWQALGRRATLWWRDDDACSDSAALRRLLAIGERHRVPLAIAAIPATTDATLLAATAACADVRILQHGYAHRNFALPGERSAELGEHRPLGDRVEELARGRQSLAGLFGARFAPILVPPWNRIGADMPPRLASAGFAGLSRFGARAQRFAAPGLLQVNAHVDLIAWRRERAFIGVDAALERLTRELAARRTASVDADEPTGVLTHHLDLTDAAFDFLDALIARTRDHAAAAWLDARDVFETRRPAGPSTAFTSARSA